MKIQIRELRANELPSAFALLKLLRNELRLSEFNSIYEQAKSADDYAFIGAFKNDVLVGLAGYRTLFDFLHGKNLYLDDLVIHPDQRSQGIGAQLLQRLEAVAKRSGCRGLRLSTGAMNRDAIRFYEREGWAMQAVTFKKGF